MNGPQSFSVYDSVGFEVEGIDIVPVVGLLHFAGYYKDLAVACGFRKCIDWSCYLVKKIEDYRPYLKAVREEFMKGQNIQYTIFSKKEFKKRKDEILNIFNIAWDGNWGHLPLTQKQFDGFVEELVQVVVPELVVFAEDNGKTVGFIISLPDINPALRVLNGRMYPWRILRFLREAKKTKNPHNNHGCAPGIQGQKNRRRILSADNRGWHKAWL